MATKGPITLTSTTPIREVIQDVDGYIQGPDAKFLTKYFPTLCSAQRHDDTVQKFLDSAGDTGILLSKPPTPPSFLQWFRRFNMRILEGALGEWHIHLPLESEAHSRESLLFLTSASTSHLDSKQEWGHVQVVGRFFEDTSHNYQDGLLDLCDSARMVFTSQPTRLFLHGLYMRGSLVELWVFDRSGIYCSEAFDYQNEFTKFVGILLRYRLMTAEDLGKNKMIKSDESGSYIAIENATLEVPGQRVYLEDRAIVIPEDIVGDGTTLFRAKALHASQWEYVVKFKWRLAWRDRPEEDMLRLIKEKNAWGVIRFEHSVYVESTSNLRRGLQTGRYRKFVEKNDEETTQPQGLLDNTAEKGDPFEDRICTCIITSPPGRNLSTFKSALELLQVLRDAIKAHRSLLQDANILHQDISPGNIIITDAQDDEKPKGILIDFDVAMDLAVGPRTPGEVTGTRPFMAVGILLARRHSYRHDLESFLYVLIWSAITQGSESPPRGSKLKQWSRGDWDDIATRKAHDMTNDGFPAILTEFPTQFESLKPLAEAIRQILFPIVDGELWTETNNSREAIIGLYEGVIGAFEDAISAESRE